MYYYCGVPIVVLVRLYPSNDIVLSFSGGKCISYNPFPIAKHVFLFVQWYMYEVQNVSNFENLNNF